MNEKYKKIYVGVCFLLLVLVIFIQSIVYNNLSRRTDIEIDNLERQLDRTRTEIADGRRTITECRTTISDISDGIRADNTELNDIIANLRKVREGIEVMENSLNYFYDKYGSVDYDIDNKEVTK